MDKNYDVIIIGAGPSGCSTAYNIKRFYPKANVLLLDKATFPRYKPCGGGVSPKVADYFDFDLMPSIDYVCNDVVMLAKGKEISSSEHALWMVRREIFDSFLLEKAMSIGVEFIDNCEVTSINFKANSKFINANEPEKSIEVVDKNNEKRSKFKSGVKEKVAVVNTALGEFRASIVVIAEGSCGKLAKKMQIAPKNEVLAA